MVKLREAHYCNLKLLLIFLVVYGHLIETSIWDSELLMMQYRWIYLFHMPLFSFLSGLFLNKADICRTQLRKIFPLYILLQIIAVFLGNGKVVLLTPAWHLWYLLSYSIWLCLAWIWFRFCRGQGKIIILICSIVVGLAVGFVPFIGRELSLSRTLVFLPYFWTGLIVDPSFPWRKTRFVGSITFVITLVLMFSLNNEIPVSFLYQAEPYGNLRNGMFFRLLCYLMGGAMCLFLISFTSTRRFLFTKAGANTMPVYLFHAPFVLVLRRLNVPWQCHIIFAIAVLYVIYITTRWHGKVYGIVPAERRKSSWLPFKTSMKNMLSQCIVFFCH